MHSPHATLTFFVRYSSNLLDIKTRCTNTASANLQFPHRTAKLRPYERSAKTFYIKPDLCRIFSISPPLRMKMHRSETGDECVT